MCLHFGANFLSFPLNHSNELMRGIHHDRRNVPITF